MNKYEAASFYGDYRELLAEIADELYDEKMECTTIAESFNDNPENFDIDFWFGLAYNSFIDWETKQNQSKGFKI